MLQFVVLHILPKYAPSKHGAALMHFVTCSNFELCTLVLKLLKRLDDSSDDVRRAIAPCLAEFFRVTSKEDYGTTLREYTLDMLLVHLDDQVGMVLSDVATYLFSSLSGWIDTVCLNLG